MAADDLLPGSPALNKRIDPGLGAVETGNGKALAFHVQHKVFTHDGQPDDSDIRLIFHDAFSSLVRMRLRAFRATHDFSVRHVCRFPVKKVIRRFPLPPCFMEMRAVQSGGDRKATLPDSGVPSN
jgi:hypothetical protein